MPRSRLSSVTQRCCSKKASQNRVCAGESPGARSLHQGKLPRAVWRRNAQLLADRAGQRVGDLSVTRERGRALSVHAPIAVATALSQQPGAVLFQMPFEVSSLHAATILSDSLPTALPCGSCSAARNSSIPARASSAISRASSLVRPWLSTPGTSGMEETIQPSPPSS